MREPSLKETTALSVVLHILVFFAALMVLKRSSYISLPSPYTVRLVSPTEVSHKKPKAGVRAKTAKTVKKVKTKTTKKRKPGKVVRKVTVTVKERTPPADIGTGEEKIAVIRAKKRVKKVVELRRAVLSVKKERKDEGPRETARENAVGTEGGTAGSGSLTTGYYLLIKEKVWSEWVFPEFRTREGLETVVNIKIFKNGRVEIEGVEKSSGNTLFDRSVLRAISKASPLPPPPYAMAIGLRFTP